MDNLLDVIINFALLCLSIRYTLKVDVICISVHIGMLLLKEAIIVQGLTVQKLTVVDKKPLPVNVISLYREDVLLQLLYDIYISIVLISKKEQKEGWMTKLNSREIDDEVLRSRGFALRYPISKTK